MRKKEPRKIGIEFSNTALISHADGGDAAPQQPLHVTTRQFAPGTGVVKDTLDKHM
jgi:hypothetical protein